MSGWRRSSVGRLNSSLFVAGDGSSVWISRGKKRARITWDIRIQRFVSDWSSSVGFYAFFFLVFFFPSSTFCLDLRSAAL